MNALKKRLGLILFGARPEPASAPVAAPALGELRHLELPETETPPPGFVWVEGGQLKRETDLTDYERDREAALAPLIQEWAETYLALSDLKARIGKTMDELEAKCAPRNTKRVRDQKKPSLTLFTLDRAFSIRRAHSDRVTYQEDMILRAKAKIDECLAEWSDNSREEIVALVNLAFKKTAKNDFSRAEMTKLRQLKSEDARWNEAMAIIQRAEIVDGVAAYLLVSVRDKDGAYHPLPLDIAGVRPVLQTREEAAP